MAIIGAGCTSAPPHPSAPPGTGTRPVTVSSTPPSLPARSLPSPGCTTATAPSSDLTGVRTAMVPVRGAPFGVAVTPDGRWSFTAVPGGVDVLRDGASLAPTLARTIPTGGDPAGVTITRDGRYLLAASGSGAVVISVARAEQGAAGAVLGTLTAPGGGPLNRSAIEVAVSPDEQFAFVTLEYTDKAVVFNLGKALRAGFGPADYVGGIPLGQAAVGMAISPDSRWLYATSEVGQRTTAQPVSASRGTLTVIDLRKAETAPASSVVATVTAGCQPVRVITSANGSQVWVTARASDDLLCFSAARLASDPAHALVAIVRVGEAPVGLAAVRGGSLIVVADSNRFGASGATASLDVVNVKAALAGGQAVVGHIPSGAFPREMALFPDGTLLVSNFGSGQLEAVDVPAIPAS